MNKVSLFVHGMLREPPFRMVSRALVKAFSSSIRAKAEWDTVARPNYLAGVLKAADQARTEGIPEIAVLEFGVAAGAGLVALQECAVAVEKETGVKIKVYGFDSGGGLPELCGDYRDHPDWWCPMDYPMDEAALRKRLDPARTDLILGNVRDTVPQWVRTKQAAPIGFVSFDLDLYSSTMDAFKIFTEPGKKMLRRVTIYFDDINFFFNHEFAGERLAINEFNAANQGVKIDKWRGIANNQVFKDRIWLDAMYVAHDIEAISKVKLARRLSVLSG
jgi:hypothetical protein